MGQLVFTEDELKTKPNGMSDTVYNSLVKDLSVDWGCFLCGIKVLFTGTNGIKITGLQSICCPECGQSTLRPSREIEEKEKVK